VTQHLVILHGTDKTGGHWYSPIFMPSVPGLDPQTQAVAVLEELREAGDPRASGQIGGVWEVPETQPTAIERTAAGLAGEATIRAVGH